MGEAPDNVSMAAVAMAISEGGALGKYETTVLLRCPPPVGSMPDSPSPPSGRKIRAAIAAIPETAWTPIPYWLSTPEVSGADVAETSYRCFAGTRDSMRERGLRSS